MADHIDRLAARDPEVRQREQFAELRDMLAKGLADAPGLARAYRDVEVGAIRSVADLARLPLLRKHDLIEMQREDPPFGGLTTLPTHSIDYVFQSPGPINEPGMVEPDWWRMARALTAAGLDGASIALNCFAYHLTPAGHMMENGARAVGASVIPGGTGNSEAQVRLAAAAGATFYVGTPDFLKTLCDKADALDLRLSIWNGLVSGGPFFPAMRAEYRARGIDCLQCYATADVGLIAYETFAPGAPDAFAEANPGMVVDEGVILEIVRPGTGDLVPPGEVGEVVVTPLNPDYPLVRFATGDLSAMLEGPSPCGRTGPRIKGWLGRADQAAKVRGMFVRPEQVADLVARHAEVGKARVTIMRIGDSDGMRLDIEPSGGAGAVDTAAIAATFREVTKLRADVAVTAPGSLANDGKVIDDTREFG